MAGYIPPVPDVSNKCPILAPLEVRMPLNKLLDSSDNARKELEWLLQSSKPRYIVRRTRAQVVEANRAGQESNWGMSSAGAAFPGTLTDPP
jgi:hypothetical protein